MKRVCVGRFTHSMEDSIRLLVILINSLLLVKCQYIWKNKSKRKIKLASEQDLWKGFISTYLVPSLCKYLLEYSYRTICCHKGLTRTPPRRTAVHTNCTHTRYPGLDNGIPSQIKRGFS